jgi:DNA-directed RNA polymerase subunit RPC12/RpoP
MYDMCPGKSMRNVKAKMYLCRNCGAEVEMFSDELRTRCRQCRNFIYIDQLPYCIQGYLDMTLDSRIIVESPAAPEIGALRKQTINSKSGLKKVSWIEK